MVNSLGLCLFDVRPNGVTKQFAHPKIFKFRVVCNPFQSSPSSTIIVPLWFIIISWVLFYLGKQLFSGSLQFKGNFAPGQNHSKCPDGAFSMLCKRIPSCLLTVVMVCQRHMKVRVNLAGAGSRQSIPVDVRNGILLVIQMSSVKPEKKNQRQ